MEIWKDIEGYENIYQISNLGRVKSLERLVKHSKGGFQLNKEIILKNSVDKNKYCKVVLCKNKFTKTLLCHRLVAKHFLVNTDNLPLVNHKDKNPLNNSFKNLEWVSSRENICHSKLKGKFSSDFIGVSYIEKYKKFQSTISINNKNKNLGSFKTEEEAYKARVNFEKDNNIKNKYL